MLPPFLHAFARLIPASCVFESMRTIPRAGPFPGDIVVNLLVGALFAGIYLLIAPRFFIHIYRKNMQSGNMARFNAEAF